MDDRTMAMGAKQADGTTHIGGHGRVGRQRGARWRPRLPARRRRRQHRRLLLHATALPVKVCVYKFENPTKYRWVSECGGGVGWAAHLRGRGGVAEDGDHTSQPGSATGGCAAVAARRRG